MRGPARPGRRCSSSTASASSRADTSTSATRWPRPGWTSGPTTIAATAAPADGAATSIAGRSSTTTSRSGWRPSAPAPAVVRSCSTATRWAASSRPATCAAGPADARTCAVLIGAWPRLDAARLEEVARHAILGGVAADAVDPERHRSGRPCRGTRRSGERAAADPPNASTSTARFGAEASRSRLGSRRRACGSTVPTLVLHGLDDGLVPAAASDDPRRRSRRSSDATYPGLRHELHNEPEGAGDHRRDHRLAEGACYSSGPQPNIASGERTRAESVAAGPQTRRT